MQGPPSHEQWDAVAVRTGQPKVEICHRPFWTSDPFWTDRSRFPAPADVQEFSGIAPVTKQSGNTRVVHRRYACPKFHRQTLLEWVGQTITRSLWSKAYYQQQRAKGVSHYTALRALAYKWLRIIWRCWQDRTAYCEETYLKALRKSQSPLVPLIDDLILEAKNS